MFSIIGLFSNEPPGSFVIACLSYSLACLLVQFLFPLSKTDSFNLIQAAFGIISFALAVFTGRPVVRPTAETSKKND
jgi:hypothetical protein